MYDFLTNYSNLFSHLVCTLLVWFVGGPWVVDTFDTPLSIVTGLIYDSLVH